MNKHQLSEAYRLLANKYELKAAQRDNLDRSDDYLTILQLVHLQNWTHVADLMNKNNYFIDRNGDDPKFEIVG